MTRLRGIITLLILLLSAHAGIGPSSVGLVLSGGGRQGALPHRRDQGFGGERHSDRLRVGYLHGLRSSPGLYADRLYAGPDGRAVSSRTGSRTGCRGRIEAEYIYYFKQRRPSAAMVTLRIDFRNPQRIARLQLPTSLIPSGHTRSWLSSNSSRRPTAAVRRRLRPAFRAVPLHCDRCGRPQGGRLPQRRSGQGDPRFDDHTVGFQAYQARLDAALRRRTVQ